MKLLHEHWVAGRLEAMHALVDYRRRLADDLGDIWATAPEADRARTVELVSGIFEDTLRTMWDEHMAGRPVTTSVRYESPDRAWVEVAVDAGGEGSERKGEFAWRYRLDRVGAIWKVYQREYRIGFATSTSMRFWPMAIDRVGREYGRRPSLAELNANVPSLLGRMTKRVYRVPKGIGRRHREGQ